MTHSHFRSPLRTNGVELTAAFSEMHERDDPEEFRCRWCRELANEESRWEVKCRSCHSYAAICAECLDRAEAQELREYQCQHCDKEEAKS